MSKTNSLHYQLCIEGAKWLKNLPYSGVKYIAVELVTYSPENTDVWGTNGCESWIIEVKTSLQDFRADKRKFARRPDREQYSCGNYRYYLAPSGVIPKEEIPEGWGLLEWSGTTIETIKGATKREANNFGDLAILCSIMRREGIKKQIFNYRKQD